MINPANPTIKIRMFLIISQVSCPCWPFLWYLGPKVTSSIIDGKMITNEEPVKAPTRLKMSPRHGMAAASKKVHAARIHRKMHSPSTAFVPTRLSFAAIGG